MGVFRQRFETPPMQRGLVFNLREEVGPAEKSTGPTTHRRLSQQDPRNFLFFAYYPLGRSQTLEGIALADEQANILCGFDRKFITSLSAAQVRNQISCLRFRADIPLAQTQLGEAIGLGSDGRCYFRPDAEVDFDPVNNLRRKATGAFFSAPGNPLNWEVLDSAWLITIEYLRVNVRRFMQDRDVVLDYKGQPGSRFRNPMTVESPTPLFGGSVQIPELAPLDECFWENMTPEALAAQRAEEAEQVAAGIRAKEEASARREVEQATALQKELKRNVLDNIGSNLPMTLQKHMVKLYFTMTKRVPWTSNRVVFTLHAGAEDKVKEFPGVLPESVLPNFSKITIDEEVWSEGINWLELLTQLSTRTDLVHVNIADTRKVDLASFLSLGLEAEVEIYWGEIKGEDDPVLFLDFNVPEQEKDMLVYSEKPRARVGKTKVQNFPYWWDIFETDPAHPDCVLPVRNAQEIVELLLIDSKMKKTIKDFLWKNFERDSQPVTIEAFRFVCRCNGTLPRLAD